MLKLCVRKSPNKSSPELVGMMHYNVKTYRNRFSVLQFKDHRDPEMRKMGTVQNGQVLQASLAVHMFAKNNAFIRNIFRFPFRINTFHLLLLKVCVLFRWYSRPVHESPELSLEYDGTLYI